MRSSFLVKNAFNGCFFIHSELEIMRDEIKSLQAVKEKLKHRVVELEEEVRKTKEDAEKAKANKSDDEVCIVLTI